MLCFLRGHEWVMVDKMVERVNLSEKSNVLIGYQLYECSRCGKRRRDAIRREDHLYEDDDGTMIVATLGPTPEQVRKSADWLLGKCKR